MKINIFNIIFLCEYLSVQFVNSVYLTPYYDNFKRALSSNSPSYNYNINLNY